MAFEKIGQNTTYVKKEGEKWTRSLMISYL